MICDQKSTKIVIEIAQKEKKRAEYGEAIITKLSEDLTRSCGKGFSFRNLNKYRQFYLRYLLKKVPTLSAQSYKLLKLQGFFKSSERLLDVFPLPWSAYVSLMSVKDETARKFYEEEALRGGWSVRQLNRQISTLFFERV